MNAQEIIAEIGKLPPKEKQIVVNFVASIDDVLEFEEDDDIGLEEDIAEFERKLQSSTEKDYLSTEEAKKRLGIV